jgi:RNA polymerase sigma factor (sigma-70 family)
MIDRAFTLLSDERLAQLAATGSDPAFATLYRRYSGTLFAYCRSITRNSEDGWDALQNAMVKVLVALRRSERTAPVRPWLFCIAHNESVGILRRRSAHERAAGAISTTAVPGADEQAETREHITEVVGDVQQLPTGQRAALVMRELGDLRYDEIAVALQTTEGNARQLVFAARAGLKDSRAGRGLPCESVRDQLSLADGRLLRRRSVRAHLRTCEGCRTYAVGVRRSDAPARALGAWSPLAGFNLLESILRAAGGPAGAGLAQGGPALLGSLVARAAAVSAVAVIGVGAAEVVKLEPGHSPVAAAAEPLAAGHRASSHPRASSVTSPAVASAAATVVPASFAVASSRSAGRAVAGTARSGSRSPSASSDGPTARAPASGVGSRDAAPAAERSPRAQGGTIADCPQAAGDGAAATGQQPQHASARYEPSQPQEQQQPVPAPAAPDAGPDAGAASASRLDAQQTGGPRPQPYVAATGAQ